ncbi:MAG TPA: phage tail protein, partial [Prevotella sp.]|nr:phage tail protein [Prevotella sp.]
MVVLLFALFYFPPFQNWAVRQVSAYASRQMGMDIHVGHVHLAFPLDLSMEEVRVLQPNDSLKGVTDTVADIRSLVADVRLWPLLQKQVMVDELSFEQMKVNTANLVHTMRFKGQIGQLRLQAHGIDLAKEHVHIDNALLADAKIDLALSDTVPEDTTPSQNFWKIDLRQLRLRQTGFTLHMPGDTLSVSATFGDTRAEQAHLDLYRNLYTVRHLDWRDGGLQYSQNFVPKAEGLDFNHLLLNRLNIKADSFYFCDSKLNVKIRACDFREKSGLRVDSLRGGFAMDSTHLDLSDLRLRTPESDLTVDFGMDLNAFDEKHPGKL